MKAKLFSLLMALFVFAGSAKANGSITSLQVTFHVDGKSWGPLTFPATGAEEIILDDPAHSFILQMGQVFGELEEMRSIALWYAVIDANHNNQSLISGWEPKYFYSQPNGSYITASAGELIEEQWLSRMDTKTLVFFVQAEDSSGNLFLYDNGGEYYKITFRVGDRIRFNEQNPAELILDYNANGEERQIARINFNSDGSYSPTDDLGSLSSLSLSHSNIYLDHAEEIKQEDIEASFFYKVYEKGHGTEVDWTQIDLNVATFINSWAFYAVSPNLDLTEGLEVGKDYVLEAYYQLSAGKESHTLGKTKTEGTKFRFTLVEEVIPPVEESPFQYVMMAYSWNDNEIEYPTMLAKGCPETVIQEPVYSFKIYGFEAFTEERIHDLRLVLRISEVDNPDPWAIDVWQEIPFEDYGFGMWSFGYEKAKELMLESWQDEHKKICVEFYLEGFDQNDEYARFDNDGENYKFTFTCGEDTSTKGITDFTLTINVNGEVVPVPIPETDCYEVEVPFPLYLFKIMKAEVKTDKPMKHVTFFSTLYNTADGPSYDQDAWEMTNFKQQAENTWVVDYQFGKELIEDEWLLQNTRMQKTYQFFVVAEDTEGKEYMYNNGDEFYKFHFTCDDADGISLTPNPSPVGEGSIYNLSGQRLQKAQKGINIIGGKKVLVK